MIVAKATVGQEVILIETAEDAVRVVNDPASDGPAIKPTRLSDRLVNSYDKAKVAIKEIAADFSAHMHDSLQKGQKLELEFGLSLSAGGTLWVISGRSDCTLKVKMTWEAK